MTNLEYNHGMADYRAGEHILYLHQGFLFYRAPFCRTRLYSAAPNSVKRLILPLLVFIPKRWTPDYERACETFLAPHVSLKETTCSKRKNKKKLVSRRNHFVLHPTDHIIECTMIRGRKTKRIFSLYVFFWLHKNANRFSRIVHIQQTSCFYKIGNRLLALWSIPEAAVQVSIGYIILSSRSQITSGR